ncbi:MAG: class I SAM-dependent methyltransferase [Thermoanaerobaculia bacterium]
MDPARRWGSAEFTHTLAEVSWMASMAVLMHLNERATGDPARDWLSSWAHRYFAGDHLRVLVLGCGEGWLERAIAAWPFVDAIDAVDVSEEAIARARAAGGPKITYGVVDLNVDPLKAGAYDVIVAHSILHHVENLEHAFAQIDRAMKPDAMLVVNEYVGPNRFQFSDEVLAIINELLAALPANLRRGRVEQTTYERKERPSREFMIENDPSEAVRSEDLLPMIGEQFEVLESKKIGGTILMHLLYDIVQNFRFEDPRERALIEMMCATEGALVDAGSIGSDFAMLAARKKGSSARPSARPLPPRPPAARDVESDPLGFGKCGGGRRARRSGGTAHPKELAPWLLRILRVALAAARPRRANLIREQRLRAALEQLRYARSGVAPFTWIRSRTEGQSVDPSIVAMLDAIERVAAR